jgi:hypothetical protein
MEPFCGVEIYLQTPIFKHQNGALLQKIWVSEVFFSNMYTSAFQKIRLKSQMRTRFCSTALHIFINLLTLHANTLCLDDIASGRAPSFTSTACTARGLRKPRVRAHLQSISPKQLIFTISSVSTPRPMPWTT